MSELPAWINLAIAIVAGLGGLAGLAALISALSNAKTSARKGDLDAQKLRLDALVKVVNEVQAENKRLRERIQELDVQSEQLLIKYRFTQRENAVLRSALRRAGIEIPEFTPQEI